MTLRIRGLKMNGIHLLISEEVERYPCIFYSWKGGTEECITFCFSSAKKAGKVGMFFRFLRATG